MSNKNIDGILNVLGLDEEEKKVIKLRLEKSIEALLYFKNQLHRRPENNTTIEIDEFKKYMTNT